MLYKGTDTTLDTTQLAGGLLKRFQTWSGRISRGERCEVGPLGRPQAWPTASWPEESDLVA